MARVDRDSERGHAPGDHIELDGVTIDVLPTYNIEKALSSARKPVGYVDQIDDLRIYRWGDTGAVRMSGRGALTFALRDRSAAYRDDPRQRRWKRFDLLEPALVVPMHYRCSSSAR